MSVYQDSHAYRDAAAMVAAWNQITTGLVAHRVIFSHGNNEVGAEHIHMAVNFVRTDALQLPRKRCELLV